MADDNREFDLLSVVTNFYLSSRGFNGHPIRGLEQNFGIDETKELVRSLLHCENISVVYGDYHPNPHIKAFESEPISEQLEKLEGPRYSNACVYPSPRHLAENVNESDFETCPFELLLRLGQPQLSFLNFDLSVLEIYRNDPRYFYQYNDSNGFISITDEYYESEKLRVSDQILLETFGISFDENDCVYVAAFLRYLSNLSPEHQQIWNAKLIEVEAHLHPNYYKSSILGDWPDKLSLYEAVLLEMDTINEISDAIGRPRFFRHSFSAENRPIEFGYLLRSTLKEFNDFIHLLDKMLSENINQEFFQDEVELEIDIPRKDGKVEVRRKGSLQIVEDWIRAKFQTEDWDDIEEMFATFRKIRKLRQKPAHSVRKNTFDQKYLSEQREIMRSAYRAVKALRLILHLYPGAAAVEVDRHLEEGLIWAV